MLHGNVDPGATQQVEAMEMTPHVSTPRQRRPSPPGLSLIIARSGASPIRRQRSAVIGQSRARALHVRHQRLHRPRVARVVCFSWRRPRHNGCHVCNGKSAFQTCKLLECLERRRRHAQAKRCAGVAKLGAGSENPRIASADLPDQCLT